MGGVLRGSVLLDWSNDLVVAADAALARSMLSAASATFLRRPLKMDGELGGNGSCVAPPRIGRGCAKG